MNCESPRFQLCQAVIDALGLPNGKITILVKDGRAIGVLAETRVNADEPEKMEALRFAPEPRDSSS